MAETMSKPRRTTEPQHGTESEYRRGCRCEQCRRAASEARASRRARDRVEREDTDLALRREQAKEISAVVGEVCDLAAEEEGLFHRYMEARRLRDEAERILARAEVDLKERMGSAENLRVRGRVVLRWATVVSERFDSRRFRAERADLWLQYSGPFTVRRFWPVGTYKKPGARR